MYFSLREKNEVKNLFECYESWRILAEEDDQSYVLVDSQDDMLGRVGQGVEFARDIIEDMLKNTVSGSGGVESYSLPSSFDRIVEDALADIP